MLLQLIFITTILAAFTKSVLFQLLLFAVLGIFAILAGDLAPIKKSFRYFWPLLLFTMLIHLFLRFESPYLAPLTSCYLWKKSLFFTLRNGLILLGMTLIFQQLKNIDLIHRIETWELEARYKKRQIFSNMLQPLLIGWRYSGLIQEEYHALQQIYRILGIGARKGLLERVRYYGAMIMPMILMSLSRAELLSAAMSSRGYKTSEKIDK